VHECWTLEPRADQSQGKPFCIPAGQYTWTKTLSPHFGFVVPLLAGIPGFTAVEIHPGNFPKDTHGCCIVGQIESHDFVGHSTVEFAALMAKLPDSGTIIYLDAKEQ